jgi:HPr kinase/phosphorylase
MGESGIGKSETALELIKRGHRLVSDDALEIKKVAENSLIGESPETTRNFMEIRGIGIIDIKAMYGISAIISSKSVDLIIKLQPWESCPDYDRLGIDDTYTSILDVNVPSDNR